MRGQHKALAFAAACALLLLLVVNMPADKSNSLTEEQQHQQQHQRAQHSLRQQPQLFIAVFSAIENKLQRDAIRQTWANKLPSSVIVQFFVGSGTISDEQMRILRAESNKNKDLAFLPQVTEAYSSLSEKLLHSIQWIYNMYPKSQFVAKVDDDSFVRVDLLLKELSTLDLSDKQGLYWGYFDGRAPVQRHGKWEEHDWFLSEHYLPYALGGGYVISSSIVEFIGKNAELFQAYRSEDVSMGVWTAPLNILRKHDSRFDTEWKSRGCHNDYLITHKQSTADMYAKYQLMSATNGEKMCTVETDLRASYEYNWKANPRDCCRPGV
eukprot:m.176125 g.176125  ORF g.176125 m.176125 type:complete len:324 (+) comp16555_c1_seq2:188-1159(+)